MTEIYDGTELPREKLAKKKFLRIFFILLSILVVIDIACIVFFALLPYKSPLAIYPKLVVFILTALFAFFYFPIFSIKYSRIRHYVKTLGYIQTGLKEGYSGEFIEFSKTTEVKEGVDFYNMTTYEWNENKQEYFIRKVLIDNEKAKPEFVAGEMTHYITQGNILTAYEKLPKSENEPTSAQKKLSVESKDRREKIKCAQ